MCLQRNLFSRKYWREIQDAVVDRAVAAAAALTDSSEEEVPTWGGSLLGKAPNKDREFEGAYIRLVDDYFSGVRSKYDEADFERRNRVSRNIFERVKGKVVGKGRFIQRHDASTLKIHILES